jgi:hypothetical protein
MADKKFLTSLIGSVKLRHYQRYWAILDSHLSATKTADARLPARQAENAQSAGMTNREKCHSRLSASGGNAFVGNLT